mmetsp:Transcript_78503/g.163088  ORF Transcript_78503/g.163088 Transcript_78503/m.163088 type:complete len:452 (-) Transcript_78503:16-1371(-)
MLDQSTGVPESTWLGDLKRYEQSRRRELRPDLCTVGKKPFTHADQASKDRHFNPVLQKHSDPETERQYHASRREADLQQLNRARDVQLKREHERDVITHQDRWKGAKLPADSSSQVNEVPILSFPNSYAGYNILSNKAFDEHHWDKPAHRPLPQERGGKARLVPTHQVKDFNIVTNRYVRDHDEKTFRDEALMLLKNTETYRSRNYFDPVRQTLTDPSEEADLRAIEDANLVETMVAAEEAKPKSFKDRISNAYDIVNHKTTNSDQTRRIDETEAAKKARYRDRYEIDKVIKAYDIVAQDRELRRVEKVSYDRYRIPAERGYDILTQKDFGEGTKEQHRHLPAPQPAPSVWSRLHDGLSPIGAAEDATLRLPTQTMGTTTSRLQPPRRRDEDVLSARSSRTGVSRISGSERSSVPLSARLPLSSSLPPPPPAPKVLPGTPQGSVYSSARRP